MYHPVSGRYGFTLFTSAIPNLMIKYEKPGEQDLGYLDLVTENFETLEDMETGVHAVLTRGDRAAWEDMDRDMLIAIMLSQADEIERLKAELAARQQQQSADDNA
jgi:hypothetical protein